MSRDRALNLGCVALALAFAWCLKSFYSRAGFDELRWVLAPTARLVEWLTGAAFELEAGRGFLSRDRLFEIVPACAGINFMIAAFCSLACGLVHTQPTLRARLDLIAWSALAAYAATVVANATRIAIALRMRDARLAIGPLTPEQLHCAEGVAVYFVFLCGLFALGARVTGARRELAF